MAARLTHSQLKETYPSLIPSSFECPISSEVMEHPVIHPECGHSFEQLHIEEWLDSDATCPLCRKEVTANDFVPNRNLESAISDTVETVFRTLNNTEKKLQSTEKGLRKVQKSRDLVQAESNNIRQNMTVVQGELGQKESALQKVMVDLKSTQKGLRKTQQNRDHTEHTLAEALKALDEKNQRIQRLNSSVQKLQVLLEESEHGRYHAERKVRELKGEQAELKTKLEWSEHGHYHAENELYELRHKLSEMETKPRNTRCLRYVSAIITLVAMILFCAPKPSKHVS